MNRLTTLIKAIITCFPAVLIMAACHDSAKKNAQPDLQAPQAIVADTQVHSSPDPLSLTRDIMQAIKRKDYRQLAGYMDPEQGTRFSPYGYVDTTVHLHFTATEFLTQATRNDNKKFKWGYFDGSGDTILLTIPGYFEKFVYDVDFLHPEKRSLNKSLAHGNSLNNIAVIYRGALFTESYFSGFDKQYGGMDWRALKLVFRKHPKGLYLIAIVHDQWTT